MFLVLHPKTKNLFLPFHLKPAKLRNSKGSDRLLSLFVSLSQPFAQTIFGTNREKALELRAFFIPRKPLILLGFRAYPFKFALKRAFRFLL